MATAAHPTESASAATDPSAPAEAEIPKPLLAWRAYFEGSQMFREALERSLRVNNDMSLSDYNIMLVLSEAEENLCMREIAEKLVFLPSRLTYAIQSLKKRGFVEQVVSPLDRRVQLVHLTPLGESTFSEARATHRRDVVSLLLNHLSEDDVDILARIFTDLKARLSD